MTQNIVLPIDLDDENSWREALPLAVDHARRTGARLHALTVIPDTVLKMAVFAHLIPEGLEQRLSDDAEKRLHELVLGQEPEGCSIDCAVRHGSIHQQILQYCDDVRADLVIMSAQKTELKDYVLGPNAAHIVRHAPCSVWLIRP